MLDVSDEDATSMLRDNGSREIQAYRVVSHRPGSEISVSKVRI